MPRFRRLRRDGVVAAILLTAVCWIPHVALASDGPVRPHLAGAAISARTLAATSPSASGPCSVPGIGDIGGLIGFCTLGQSGLLGDLNNLCQPSVPDPESANAGINALVRPPVRAGHRLATPYNQYGVAGQYWAATKLQCSDMTSLIGNSVAGMLFDVAKSMDRVTITIYQAAAGEGIVSWLQGAADRLISGLGHAIYFPYLAVIVILGAIWLAWNGLIRKRGSRTIEGTVWMIIACAAAIWLIGRPADFTGLGKGVSDGMSTALNAAFAHLPTPGQAACLPIGHGDPQIQPASFAYTSGSTVVDQNANELWTVLVCKPWLNGEFGTTTFTAAGGKATPVNTYGRQLLWAQAIAVGERPTAALISAKQASYSGIAASIQQHDPAVFPMFQGKQWTSRLEIAIAALLAAVVAGVLVLLVAVTLILLKLGFLLLLIVGPFFLLIGTHPGFGRVVAFRWFEMLIGVLLKQAAVALALSVLLYCYALIMGTPDAVLPWALKILMIALVTLAVFIYRKPFQHLFTAVGYGVIGSADRADSELSRAAATGASNTRTAATLAVPGFAAYRMARWARRNPAQAAGLALSAAALGTGTAASGVAGAAETGALANGSASPGAEDQGSAQAGGAGPDAAGQPDPTGTGRGTIAARAKAWGASADTASGREAPPLTLPPRQPGPSPMPGPTGGGAAGAGRPAAEEAAGAAAGAAAGHGIRATAAGARAGGGAAVGGAVPGGSAIAGGPAGRAASGGGGAGARWPTAGGLSSKALAGSGTPAGPPPPAAPGRSGAAGNSGPAPPRSSGSGTGWPVSAAAGRAASRPSRPPAGRPDTGSPAPSRTLAPGPGDSGRAAAGGAGGGRRQPGRSGGFRDDPRGTGQTSRSGRAGESGRGSWLSGLRDNELRGRGTSGGGTSGGGTSRGGTSRGGAPVADQGERDSWFGRAHQDARERPDGAGSWLGGVSRGGPPQDASPRRTAGSRRDGGSGPWSGGSRSETGNGRSGPWSGQPAPADPVEPSAGSTRSLDDPAEPAAAPGQPAAYDTGAVAGDGRLPGPFWLRPVRRRK